jgi:hypothetical protein
VGERVGGRISSWDSSKERIRARIGRRFCYFAFPKMLTLDSRLPFTLPMLTLMPDSKSQGKQMASRLQVPTAKSAISIPLSSLPPYECGAILFSYLAFPDPVADLQRSKAHAALCSLALRANAADDGTFAPHLVKPGYLLLREGDIRAALRSVDRRMKDRLSSAIIAKPFLEQATTGRPPRLPPEVSNLSLSTMAEYVMFHGKADHDRGDIKNFHARVLRPSLPVIHLAVALNLVFERTKPAGLMKFGIYDLIRSPEAIRFLIETAQPLEVIFMKISRLGIGKDTLLRFRLS